MGSHWDHNGVTVKSPFWETYDAGITMGSQQDHNGVTLGSQIL